MSELIFWVAILMRVLMFILIQLIFWDFDKTKLRFILMAIYIIIQPMTLNTHQCIFIFLDNVNILGFLFHIDPYE